METKPLGARRFSMRRHDIVIITKRRRDVDSLLIILTRQNLAITNFTF